MDKDHVYKLLNVWKSKNKILNPVDKKVILKIVDQIASLFSPGNFFYIVFNFSTYEIEYVSEGVKNVIGIAPQEFTFEKLMGLLHPEDLEKMHEKELASLTFKLNKISKENITKYKTVYLLRYKTNSNSYKTILHQAKVIDLSEDGKINRTLSVHTDISHLNIPMDHKVTFISEENPNFYSLDFGQTFHEIEKANPLIFTGREKQIIKEISKGKSFNEIAQILSISLHTINTHKKNILKKSKCKNTAELIARCVRDGVI